MADETSNSPNSSSNSSLSSTDERAETCWTAAEEPAAEPAPAQAQQKNLSRPSAQDIYKQVEKNAREELKRSSISLGISGFTGGVSMGLSALGVGILLAKLGGGHAAFILSRMLYPLGFIVVILGRAQLFTENTLYPVALVLTEPRHIWDTMRLWAIVLPSNVLGALAFAALAALTPAMPTDIVQAIAGMGLDAAHTPIATIFWSGVVGGWIIATTAWLVSGSHTITGSVMIIWVLTFVVGMGNFAHCIATSGEILIAVLRGELPWMAYPHWLGPAVAGNVCGGVGMVTLLEYGQAVLSRPTEESPSPERA